MKHMENNVLNLTSKQKIKDIYESYSSCFSEIMNDIVSVLQSNIKLMSQPTYKTRVKSFNSYYKKVLRLKSKEINTTESIVYLTDMMGIRVICAFLEDINITLEQIKKIFQIKEIEVKGAEKKISEFGYESIHVLVSIPKEIIDSAKLKFNDIYLEVEELVCEIQIRTILQDAWAEVEHELIYKTEFTPFDMPLRRKLASINASLSLADTIFQEIRDYQKKLQMETATRRESFYEKVDETTGEFSEEEKSKLKSDTKEIGKASQF